MPYSRPGSGVYVTNGGTPMVHGQAAVNGNFVGVAVKQKVRSWQVGYALQKTIDAAEPYYLITHGIVQVSATGITTPAAGNPVYITSAGALTSTATGNLAFGQIVEIAGQRGVPTGMVRIDLDSKRGGVTGA